MVDVAFDGFADVKKSVEFDPRGRNVTVCPICMSKAVFVL
jgi:hypothetical protein